MKRILPPSPMVILVLGMVAITLLVLMPTALMVNGQNPPNTLPQIQILVDSDRLTLYIDSPVPVSLSNTVLQVAQSNGTTQVFPLIGHFNGALQLKSGVVSPGDCYVFEVSGTSLPLPNQCAVNTTFVESVAPASVFWYDRTTRQFASLAIIHNGIPIGLCPAGINCAILLVTPTPSPTFAPSQAPFILQGSNNTGNVRLATVNDIIHQTGMDAWQAAGHTGRGVKIGVIDRHFGGLGTFQARFGAVVNLSDLALLNDDNITLGVNVLEVIHNIAPDAELYACRYREFGEFQNCVTWMIEQGVDIINHSASIPAVQINGQSVWAQQVTRAAQQHILWIDAAGNFRTAVLEQNFLTTDGDNHHEYFIAQGNETLGFAEIPNLSGAVMLSWADENYDLDLVVIDVETGEVITASHDSHGDSVALSTSEYLTFDMRRPFGVQVRSVGDQSYNGLPFLLYVEYATFPQGQEIGFTTPADSPDALTVGALQDGLAAPYSPGGTVSGKNKPDIVTHGEIQLADGTQFVGTTAAAPVVSGYAALVLSAHPTFSRTELYEFITRQSTQDDVEVAGPDPRYGNYGILNIPTQQVMTETPVPTPLPTEGPSATIGDDRPMAIVNVPEANLRAGPGVVYGRVGAAYQGDIFGVEGQALGWYRVEVGDGAWIAASIVVIAPENALIADIADYPAPPATRQADITATFLPPPPTDPARSVPGGVVFTPTFPPRTNLTLTPIATVTPNTTATLANVQTATRLYAGLTETATLQPPTATRTPTTVTSVGPTNTPTPTNTYTPIPLSAPILTISSGANLRSGPGTNYSIVGGANAGEQFPIVAYHLGTQFTWYLVQHPSLGRVWVADEVASVSIPNNQIPIAATIPPSPIPTNTPVVSPTPRATSTSTTPQQGQCLVRIEGEMMSGGLTYQREHASSKLTKRIGNSGGDGSLTATFSVDVSCTVQVGITYSNDHFDGNDTEWIIAYIDGNEVGAFHSVNTGLGLPPGDGWDVFDGQNVKLNIQTAMYSLSPGQHTVTIVASGGDENPAQGIEIDYVIIGTP